MSTNSKENSKVSSLVERYLYDVLLNDLPLWNGDMLCWVLPAAQPCEGATPAQRKRASKRHLHGLPAWHLPPLPRLSFETLDSLENTQWESELKGAEPHRTGCVSPTCIICHDYDGTQSPTAHYGLALWANSSVENFQTKKKSLEWN